MSQASGQRCGLLVPLRWRHPGGDLSRPNRSHQRAIRPLIRSERLLRRPRHPSDLPCLHISSARRDKVPPTIDRGDNLKSP
jgi:hypothetical protein